MFVLCLNAQLRFAALKPGKQFRAAAAAAQWNAQPENSSDNLLRYSFCPPPSESDT